MLTTYLFRYTSECVVKFSKFSSPQAARGHWPPNQNPADPTGDRETSTAEHSRYSARFSREVTAVCTWWPVQCDISPTRRTTRKLDCRCCWLLCRESTEVLHDLLPRGFCNLEPTATQSSYTIVRPWAAAVSVAAIGGCRREVVGVVDVASSCVRVSTIPIAKLYGETCTSLHTLISDGPAWPLGYPKAETPTREESSGPSTPGPPREVGLPAGEGGRTRAQPAQSPLTQILPRPQQSALQLY